MAQEQHRLGHANDDLERQIAEINRRVRESHADHPLRSAAVERARDRLWCWRVPCCRANRPLLTKC
jgi:hypothetical protein